MYDSTLEKSCAQTSTVYEITGEECLQIASSTGFITYGNSAFPQNNGVCVGRQAMSTSYYYSRSGSCYVPYSPTPVRAGLQYMKPPRSGGAKPVPQKAKGSNIGKKGQKPGGRGRNGRA